MPEQHRNNWLAARASHWHPVGQGLARFRLVDMAGAGRLIGWYETDLGSGSPGTDGPWRTHGNRGRLALLAWAGPERHLPGEGLAGAVARRGTKAALASGSWDWVLLFLGERRSRLHDGQQQQQRLRVLPGGRHGEEG